MNNEPVTERDPFLSPAHLVAALIALAIVLALARAGII